MNFAEGVKRIYITVSCLIVVSVIFVQGSMLPGVDSHARTAYYELKEAIAAKEGKSVFDINWGDQTAIEFVESLCAPPLKWEIAKANATCQKYIAAKDGIKKEQLFYAAEVLGICALTSIGLYFFWVLMAWIARGFSSKKQ